MLGLLFCAVFKTFPNKTTAYIGAICSSDISHSHMGICTPSDSQWCIQTSARVDPNPLPDR